MFGEIFINKDFNGKPVFTSINEQLKFDSGKEPPRREVGTDAYYLRWSGKLSTPQNKTVFLGLKSDGTSKLFINGELFIENTGSFVAGVDPNVVKSARIDLEKEKPLEIRVEYSKEKNKNGAVELLWAEIPENPFEKAVGVVKNSDVALIFAGLNTDYEGEGLDRFDMNLPGLQNELIAAVAKANPKTIVILNSGTPNDLTHWIDKIPAVVQSWYPGNGRRKRRCRRAFR